MNGTQERQFLNNLKNKTEKLTNYFPGQFYTV